MWTVKPPIGTNLRTNHWSVEGLKGFWPFLVGAGGEVQDFSLGNRNPGTWNGTGPHWGPGKDGPTGIFNGTDDYVDCGDITNLNSVSQFTFSAWINQDTIDVKDVIFSKSLDVNHRLMISTWDNGNMYFEPDSSTNRGYFDYSTVINAGQWHHIMMVFNGLGIGNNARLKVYVDGSQVTLTFAGVIPNVTPDLSGQPVIIGDNVDVTNPFQGLIDNATIYNWALSAAQGWELYTNPHIQFEPPITDGIAEMGIEDYLLLLQYNSLRGGMQDLRGGLQ